MRERSDTERLEWLLEQNRLGYNMAFVRTRVDVDSLMDDDSEPFPIPVRRAADAEGGRDARD